LIFLANLRLHLAHFAGQHARAIIPTQMIPGPKDAAFARLCDALGVSANLQPGDRFDTSGDGVPLLGGTVVEVRRVTPVTAYFLLLDEPVPGTAFVAVEGAGDQVAASLYLYLYGAQAAALPDTWAPFLADRLGTADAAAAQT
jgi:hypothetical protein